MRFFKDPSFQFLDGRRRAYVVSATLLAIGLAALVARGGLSYGVEFTGGTLMQVRFEETTSVGELRDVLNQGGLTGVQLQGFGEVNEFLIRVQTFEAGGEQDVGQRVRDALDASYGEEGYNVVRVEAVGPKVGGELQRKAATAILLSFLLTLAYLAFRFEWRFGVAAVVATLHDILLTFGFIAILNVEITLATVAAILTIVGYSLNDTIVTFDRMRENLKKHRKESYVDLLNRSINEVLPRTIMTSLTTLVTLLALFLFGGSVIRPFALVLILGVAVGTYSSICRPCSRSTGGWSAGRRRRTPPAKGRVPLRLFDSHLHLTDERLRPELAGVLERAAETGVEGMVTVGTSPEDARAALELARGHEGLWCTAGLHPHDAGRYSPELIETLGELLGSPEAVAVGETGLDYHYDNAPRERQRESFRAHVALARELDLPVVVHSRDADADTARILRETTNGVVGVMHCFTGGAELLETALELGWYVSFSGIVTFGSWTDRELVRRVPGERLLIETDSPYLAPVPERGGRNEPAFVAHTCRAVAEMRGEEPAVTAERTLRNARAFYGLD